MQLRRVRASSLPPGMQTAALQRTVPRGGSVARTMARVEAPVGVAPRRQAEMAIEALEAQLQLQLQVRCGLGHPAAVKSHEPLRASEQSERGGGVEKASACTVLRSVARQRRQPRLLSQRVQQKRISVCSNATHNLEI